jgi:hypothetical protein
MFVERLLNVKLLLQSEDYYLFTKIHGVLCQITGISTRLNTCISENYVIVYIHSVMDTGSDCIVVTSG